MAKRQVQASELECALEQENMGVSTPKQTRLEARLEAAHVRKDSVLGMRRQIVLNCGTSASAASGRESARGPLQHALMSAHMGGYEDLGIAPLMMQEQGSEDDQENIFVEGADLGQSAPGSLADEEMHGNLVVEGVMALDSTQYEFVDMKSHPPPAREGLLNRKPSEECGMGVLGDNDICHFSGKINKDFYVTHECNKAKNIKIKPLDIPRPDIYTQKSGLSEEALESEECLSSNSNQTNETYCSTETTSETPSLLRAVVMEEETAVKQMLAESAGTGTADANGYTALHIATEKNNSNEVWILLCKGADPNARCIRGRTPLHIAAAKGYLQVCDQLLICGACPRKCDNDNITPFHEVVRNGNLEILKMLTCIRGPYDISVLVLATQLERVDICQCLLEQGWFPFFTFGGEIPPLYYAAKLGNKSIVKLLLAYGDFPLAADSDGCTPLHLAALHGHDHIIPLLARHSAHLSPLDSKGLTPLHLAAGHGHVKAVKELLRRPNAFDLKDGTGCTALGLAAAGGWMEVCRCLLEAGASPSDPGTSTPALHAAAGAGRLDVVRLLLEAGVPPNLRNPAERTPLHSATQGGHVTVMNLLVYWGATVQAKDKDGLTPAQLAPTDEVREKLHKASN